MIIGVPKEVKKDEYRVGLLPVGAELLARDGHTVLIEKEAGLSSGFDDGRYTSVGAEIVGTAEEIYARADMIVKVKEPQPAEIARYRDLGAIEVITKPFDAMELPDRLHALMEAANG